MNVFIFIGRYPWPFILIPTVALIALAIAGFSQDNIVEKDISKIWSATSGEFFKNRQYEQNVLLGSSGRQDVTTFSAMAVSRDGGNLFTSSRLDEINERMKQLAKIEISYNGNTFTQDDICWSSSVGLGTTYKFSCFRLSPMDFFQESRWRLDETARLTWYNDLIYPQLIEPLVPRYGIVLEFCLSVSKNSIGSHCDHYYKMRTDPEYAQENGKDASYVETLLFFDDIGSFEENNLCKICIETMYESKMESMFSDYSDMILDLYENLKADENQILVESEEYLESVQSVGLLIDREMIEEFYLYYTLRQIYSELGASAYIEGYDSFLSTSLSSLCDDCPQAVSETDAIQALRNHADNTFSSHNTAGLPLPFWNEKTGYLFDRRDGTNELKPVGGSGLDLSHDFAKKGDPIEKIINDPGIVWLTGKFITMVGHCGNEVISGSYKKDGEVDRIEQIILISSSPKSCTKFNIPFEKDEVHSKTHFAKMWYDLIIDSPAFLNLVQGESDPYTYTIGKACGYSLTGKRFAYSNKREDAILKASSGDLYYIDEGESIGALDKNILIGNTMPPVGEYSTDNPLTSIGSIQNIYISLSPKEIIKRVENCNRPGGAITNLTEFEAEEVLGQFKIETERVWATGWDDKNSGDVQFVGFYDDVGAIGTTARTLQQVTLSGGNLMILSFTLIILFSVSFLASSDRVESRIMITIVGVFLVIISFFAALGVAILVGIKLNITIGWTLPFILIGLGVDNMYIISMALKDKHGYNDLNIVEVMKEVIVPITMTSLVNFCMFALMNISDIPAVYKTAQAAMIAIAFLWFSITFCFPAYCYLDLRRQRQGKHDVCLWRKNEIEQNPISINSEGKMTKAAYEKFYKPLIMGTSFIQKVAHIFVWLITLSLVALGIFGISKIKIGLGIEDLLPYNSQSGVWARYRTETLATFPIKMNWGQLDYTKPDTQMKMISQFENILSTGNVASNVDTKDLWIANFAVWTTKQCNANWIKLDSSTRECGNDILFSDGSSCSGTWRKNTLGLRNKLFSSDETCQAYEMGVCRPTSEMHPDDLESLKEKDEYLPIVDADESWCPVFEGWSEEKLQFCLEKWRLYTGDKGDLLLAPNTATIYDGCEGEYLADDKILSPIRISSSPNMFGIHLFTHQDTVNLIQETRKICDEDDQIHCFMSGAPYQYWEQYINIDSLLFQSAWVSVSTGFGVSMVFLFFMFLYDKKHPFLKILCGSFAGALIIGITCVISIITVVGLSALANVSLTAFSVMSFILSIGFVVEYSVHITHRFMTAPLSYTSAKERVEYAMSFLFLPTFMSFVSSTIGVICLALTKFTFTQRFFFRPLVIVMFVTYFYGCYFLPVLLSLLELDLLRLGHQSQSEDINQNTPKSISTPSKGEEFSENDLSEASLNETPNLNDIVV